MAWAVESKQRAKSPGSGLRILRSLLSARPGFQVFIGLLAIVFALMLSTVLIVDEGVSSEALLPLVFAVYGVIHIGVFTDIGLPRHRRSGSDE